MGNELEAKKTFSNYMASEAVQYKLKQIISDKTNSARFTTAIVSTVVNNPALVECDFTTIFSAALEAESMKLSLSPKLGQSYLVPFNDTKNNRKVATFQIGYKGYIQLAMRSGQYKDIDAIEIKEGEYKGKDSETGKPIIAFIGDDAKREELKTVGYLAYFELLNGFKKSLFWTKEKMTKHALTYSKGFAAKKGYTFWEKSFDDMAFKTLLRQIISKWGVMSIEMQNAFVKDMSIISEDGIEYFDNDDNPENGKPEVKQPEELKKEDNPPKKTAEETAKAEVTEQPKEQEKATQEKGDATEQVIHDFIDLRNLKYDEILTVKGFVKSITPKKTPKGKDYMIVTVIDAYNSKTQQTININKWGTDQPTAGVLHVFENVKKTKNASGQDLYVADKIREATDDDISL